MSKKNEIKTDMKAFVILLFLIFGITIFMFVLKPANPLPDKSDYLTLEEEQLALAQGKTLIKVFYKTYCPYCKQESAELEKLQQGNSNVIIEWFNVGETFDRRVSQELGKYDFDGVPFLVFMKGNKQRTKVGYSSLQELEEVISQL